MKRIFAGVLATLTALLLAATLAPAQATAPDSKSFVVAHGDKTAKAACEAAADSFVPDGTRHVDLKICRVSRLAFDFKVHVWPHWKNKPVRLHYKRTANGTWTEIRKRKTDSKGWTKFAAVSKPGFYKVSVPKMGEYKRSESTTIEIVRR